MAHACSPSWEAKIDWKNVCKKPGEGPGEEPGEGEGDTGTLDFSDVEGMNNINGINQN